MNEELNNENTLEKETTQNKIKNDILEKKTSEFTFNILEITSILIFPCCLKGQLKVKNFINDSNIIPDIV